MGGWSPSPLNTRYQSAEQAGLRMAQVRHLKLKWAFGFAGDVTAFAAPTVLNGTLFVGSAGGVVQALDAKTGCVHWMFQANGPVRAAILPVRNSSSYSLVFSDLIGWVYSLEAKTGKLLWKRLDEHEATRLTGSPVAQNGIVFIPAASWEETRSVDPQYECCTFRGSVSALSVRDGSLVWKSYMVDVPHKTGMNSVGVAQWGPSGAPIWSSPTLDAKSGLLYVTTGDNYSVPATSTSDAVIALNLKTGRIVWTQQVISNDAYTSACRTKGVNCPSTTVRITISDRRPCSSAARTEKKFLWPGKNPAWSMRSIRTQRAKSFGKPVSARVALTAECSGAWPATHKKCTRPFPMCPPS